MRRLSLRAALLAAFLVSSGAPLLVFWAWPHSAALENEMRSVRERHQLIATTLAGSLEHYHRDVVTVFDSLTPIVAAGGDLGLAERRLAELHFHHVCVVDGDTGVIVRSVATGGPDCPERASPERLDLLLRITAGGDTALTPAIELVDGSSGMLAARRSGEDLVVGSISNAFFVKLAGGVRFGERGHAVVVDGEGGVLAHPDPEWTRERRDLSAIPAVQALKNGESGVGEFFSPKLQEQMITGYAVAENSGWGVMVPQPLVEIEEKIEGLKLSATFVLALGLALSAVIALVVSNLLSRDIRGVADAARRMAAGDHKARAPENSVEARVRDISDLARSFNLMAGRVDTAHRRVSRSARTDALTGLLNRAGFFEDAESTLKAADGREHALFFLDVDRFKSVNDSFGHAAGDAALQAIASRLRKALGETALIARQGGDEFLVLAPKQGPHACARLGARILRALRAPVNLGEREVALTVSVGVCSFPRDAADAEGLALRADQAMYQAKRAGGNLFASFDARLQRRLDEEATLARELRAAVEERALSVEFQPIVRARSGALTGFEALARWTSPSLGPVAAERFIALAEEGGLIVDLGRQIREQACAFAAKMRRSGVELPVSVNVSQAELGAPDFAPTLLRTVAAYGLPPRALSLEITESVFQEPGPQALEALNELRRRGMTLALDDFGKGYSSHRLLRTYPVDRLKIAADFVGDVTMDPGARAVVRSMIDLGRRLNLAVTVEGVETAAQRDLVAALGADDVQGFWHHPPMDAAAALALAIRESRLGPVRRAS